MTKCIKTITAAVIQNADDAIDILKGLQNKYDERTADFYYNELKDVTKVVIEACTKVVEFITEDAINGIPNAKAALQKYTDSLKENGCISLNPRSLIHWHSINSI